MLQEFKAKLARTNIVIREVGMREVLQSDWETVLPIEDKVEIFRGLREAGLKEINVCSFASSKKMPHMANAEGFLRALGPLRDGIRLTGLVFNDTGLTRAIAMKEEGLLDGILFIFSMSKEGLIANGVAADIENFDFEPLFEQIERTAARAADAGLEVTIFQSRTFGTPQEAYDRRDVFNNIQRFCAMRGITEILISDTQGVADPIQVLEFFTGLAEVIPADKRLSFHVHDTRGAGLANILAALMSPIENLVLDASFGGLGGDAPLVADSFGNVATEDLAEMLTGLGFDHGVNPKRLVELTARYQEMSGRAPVSKMPFCSGSVRWKQASIAA